MTERDNWPPAPSTHVLVADDKHVVALVKINDIRNSIIGCQTVNWSEHIYPLVAALEEAGIEGAGYPASRTNVGTMLERTLAAENEVIGLRAAIDKAISVLDNYADPTGYTDGYGETLPADAVQHEGLLAKDAATMLRAALATATSEGRG